MENGKDWSQAVDHELGNYDYLMFADVDYSHPEVREDVKKWAEWLGRETRIKSMRLDAVKHYSFDFVKELLQHIDENGGRDWFLVAEVSQRLPRLKHVSESRGLDLPASGSALLI